MAATPQKRRGMPSWFTSREAGMVVALLALCALILLSGERARGTFLSSENQRNLWRQVALLGIFAIGETFVIVTAGIDLSVGSVIAFTGVLAALCMSSPQTNGVNGPGLSAPIAVLAALAAALGVGAVHGLLVGWLNLPPFVATLGTMGALRSAARVITGAIPISVTNASFIFLGNGKPWGIPAPFLIMGAAAVVSIVMMHATTWGRYIYAVGANEEAVRLSGVGVRRVKMLAYMGGSLLAGVAGVVHAAYNFQGDPAGGVAYELNAIAAAVIGGCSLAGGQGSVIGTLIGANIFCVVLNGLPLIIAVNASLWEGIVVGTVVIGAVTFNVLRQRRGA